MSSTETKDNTTDLLSLKLRLHLLETLLAGSTTSFETVVSSEEKQYQEYYSPTTPSTATTTTSTKPFASPLSYSLVRRHGYCREVLKEALDDPGFEAIRRFLEYYESSEPLLHANPQQQSSSNENTINSDNSLDIHSKAALVLDAATEITSLHSWLLEYETLMNRDVASAGKLNDHESLKPLLQETAKAISQMTTVYTELEDRIGQIADRYDGFVDSVSEVFLEWHRAISAVEESRSSLSNVV